MNLQVALNQAAKKYGYLDYLDAQRKQCPPPGLSWAYFDYIVLGEVDDNG